MIVDQRADLFEMAAEDSRYYDDWVVQHMDVIMQLVELVAKYMATHEAYLPRQYSGRFTAKQ